MNESKKNRIAVVAIYGKSIALWNCIKQHIDLMESACADVMIYVPQNEPISLIQEGYLSKVVVFSNKRDLKQKIKDNGIEIIWYTTIIAAFKYGRLAKHCRILLWVQGTAADESFLRKHSVIRKNILNYIEKRVFYKVDGLVYVSESMRVFFEKKYNHQFKNFAIVPCVSEFHYFRPQSEKIPESYVYIGGLSAWQCFEDIVDLYGVLRTDKSIFHIITMEVEKAKNIVKSRIGDINNISIYSKTNRNEIPEILSTFQYGFLIRKESPVNYVSSPIKFLEYISCGVNVIMTDAVPSYAKLIRDNNIGTIVAIDKLGETKINGFSPNAREVYEKYFSKEQFIDQYKRLLDKSLGINH